MCSPGSIGPTLWAPPCANATEEKAKLATKTKKIRAMDRIKQWVSTAVNALATPVPSAHGVPGVSKLPPQKIVDRLIERVGGFEVRDMTHIRQLDHTGTLDLL